jgi:hypothetical protein
MKIEFVRTGGIAGFRLAAVVDTADLPVEDASRLVGLVEAGGFDALEQDARRTAWRDQFKYHLRIASPESDTIEITVPESGVTEAMRPLLDYLTEVALMRHGSEPGASGPGA